MPSPEPAGADRLRSIDRLSTSTGGASIDDASSGGASTDGANIDGASNGGANIDRANGATGAA